MEKLDRILLCVDGSAYSTVACEYALWAAKRHKLAVDVLYVSDLWEFETSMISDLSGSLGIEPYQDLSSQLKEMEEQKAKMIGEAVRNLFESAGLGNRMSFHHERGMLVDCITEYEDDGRDLVILGKRGENANLATRHLGPTMERVVRASKKPVLVTPRAFQPMERIVFAYDGGTSCKRAAQWLKSVPLLQGLELHLITVDEERYKERASERLREAEALLEGANFNLQVQLLTGIAENEISTYVEEKGATGLIMGAHGHSRIRELLIGTTTTDLIRRCRTPLLLFR